MRLVRLLSLIVVVSIAGCTSVGSLGIVAKSSINPIASLKRGESIRDLGPAEGQACRYFALGVAPFGNSDVQTAVDRALSPSGGDALVNVTTTTSLYGFVPIYDVFNFTCTTVKGTAIKLG